MYETPREIPALLIVVPVLLLAVALMMWTLRRRDALTPMRALVGVVACVYGAGIVANTLLPIRLGGAGGGGPWASHLNLVPLVDTEPADMLMNVVVFVPLGVLLPLLLRMISALRILLVGFALSLGMELVQLVNAAAGHGGHIADVNDLLANTLGAPIGYAAFRVALLVPPLARLAAAATWPPSTSAAGAPHHPV